MHIPRIVISALRGGAGKTLLSLGLCRAFAREALRVVPCKKGPDYIDAAWLSRAAAHPATNLDPFFLSAARLRSLLALRAGPVAQASLALIEGNRGLFDGRDLLGTCSTAALAAALEAPVLLSLDCTKMTRTAAAVIHGMASFDPAVHIGGVVLNQLATPRQATLIRQCIEEYTNIPVLGSLPRLAHNPLPERHMGLVAQVDSVQAYEILDQLADLVTAHTDLPRILALARSAPPLAPCAAFWPAVPSPAPCAKVRIAYVKDAALWFYYAENLEALERAGAELLEVSVLSAAPWPQLDGLYLGGGFPEEVAEELSQSPQVNHIRALSQAHMPIYAECGGFMVLAREILRDGRSYPMANIFPVSARFHPKPQGLGYVEGLVTGANPFHPLGSRVRGHEFHYSCAENMASTLPTSLQLSTGTGMGQGKDGLLLRQTFASYTHIYAPATPQWAENFVAAAIKYRASGAL
ncbi:MAG: cobyrinate a,c-diamide synthase [Desulfovibrionaceae bacterium]